MYNEEQQAMRARVEAEMQKLQDEFQKEQAEFDAARAAWEARPEIKALWDAKFAFDHGTPEDEAAQLAYDIAEEKFDCAYQGVEFDLAEFLRLRDNPPHQGI